MSETHSDGPPDVIRQEAGPGLHLVEPPVRTLPANPHQIVKCDYCSRSIFWALTASKKKRCKWDVPAPAHQPQPEHEARFVIDGNGEMRYVSPRERALMPPGTKFYLSHFATCPYSRRELDRYKHTRGKKAAR